MTETVLKRMEQILRKNNYKVNLTPQENLQLGELVIALSDVKVKVETTQTYMLELKYELQWLCADIHRVPEEIVRIVKVIETEIGEPTFKIEEAPNIKLLGKWYRIAITVSWKDRVVIV